MRTEFRVALYLHHYGYSCERVAQLMAWPLEEVRHVKRGEPTIGPARAPMRKRTCTRKEKVTALRLVQQGKSVQEAAKEANVTVYTVKRALRKMARHYKHLPPGEFPAVL